MSDNGLSFTVELKPYRYGLAVSMGQSRKELLKFARWIDKEYGSDRSGIIMDGFDKADSVGFCIRMDGDSFLYLRDLPTTITKQGVLIHELFHVARHCLISRDIDLSGRSTEEVYAYLMEEMWNEIMHRV